MEFERLPHGAEESKKVCYYICKARQADDKCIGHQIPEKLLKALIMDQLHLFIVQLSDKRKVLEELQKIEDDGGRIVVRFKYEQSIQDTVKALHTD